MDLIYKLMGSEFGVIFIIIFFRFIVLFSYTFFLSSKAINFKIKSLISFLMALIFVNKLTIDTTNFNLSKLFDLIIGEFFIAFSIGLSITIVMYAYKLYGELLSYTAGLSMAQIFDTNTGTQEQVLNKLFYVMMIYLFFYSGFYQTLIIASDEMFKIFPIGYDFISKFNIYTYINKQFSHILLIMLTISLPFFLLTTLIDIYFGYSTRNTPAFNVFSIAFQIKFIFLSYFLYLSIPYVIDRINNIIYLLGKEDFLNG